MGNITYETRHTVRLDGRIVGEIRQDSGGWYYQPKGTKARGPSWRNLERVKRDIEEG
jgi:hypothetical protein